MYEYKCILDHVIDGDTIDASIDLGFNILVRQKIRLYGITAPSLQTSDADEKEKGIKARDRLIEILPKEFIIKTVLNKRGKIGRVLGHLYVDGQHINELLISEGLASLHTSLGE